MEQSKRYDWINSWNEVKDMNLQQFTEAMAVDLLRGRVFKSNNEIK